MLLKIVGCERWSLSAQKSSSTFWFCRFLCCCISSVLWPPVVPGISVCCTLLALQLALFVWILEQVSVEKQAASSGENSNFIKILLQSSVDAVCFIQRRYFALERTSNILHDRCLISQRFRRQHIFRHWRWRFPALWNSSTFEWRHFS